MAAFIGKLGTRKLYSAVVGQPIGKMGEGGREDP
jgi:hypothetical protein